MYLPDYHGGSIVNLMSSVSKAFGARGKYEQLKILPSKKITKKNVVLMLIDGLGYHYLSMMRGSFLYENMKGSMTSVFPPTTATVLTAIGSGVPAQQSAVTGWFMFLKEIGVVSAFLPFCPRYGDVEFTKDGISMEQFLDCKPLIEKFNAKCFSVLGNKYVYGEFSNIFSGKAKRLPYNSFSGFFRQAKAAVNYNNRRKFVYAYWSGFDHVCHHFGVSSKMAFMHFLQIDFAIRKLASGLKDTMLIVVADHGLIDAGKNDAIYVDKNPKLKECLTMPLSGEPRAAYCYVHPEKAKQFENYVRKNLGEYCWIYKSSDLVKKNFFGLGKPNRKLFDRIGDYTIIMKKNYVIRDSMLDLEQAKFIGNHGGVSHEEMFVPLIVIER